MTFHTGRISMLCVPRKMTMSHACHAICAVTTSRSPDIAFRKNTQHVSEALLARQNDDGRFQTAAPSDNDAKILRLSRKTSLDTV